MFSFFLYLNWWKFAIPSYFGFYIYYQFNTWCGFFDGFKNNLENLEDYWSVPFYFLMVNCKQMGDSLIQCCISWLFILKNAFHWKEAHSDFELTVTLWQTIIKISLPCFLCSQGWFTQKKNGKKSGTSCWSWPPVSLALISAKTGTPVEGKLTNAHECTNLKIKF